MLLMVSSCVSPPSSKEVFIKNDDRVNGRYKFELDLSDTLASYDINLYSALDCSDDEMHELSSEKLEITLISPSNISFSEVVYFPLDGLKRKDFPSKLYYLPYRVDIVPEEYGDWTMFVSFDEKKDNENIRGLGMQLIKKSNGKR